jgi:hypothetical protein
MNYIFVCYLLEVLGCRAIVHTVTDFSPKRPRFDSRSIHARFVADKVAPRRVSSKYFGFLLDVSPYYYLAFRSNPNKRTNVGSLKGSVKNFNFFMIKNCTRPSSDPPPSLPSSQGISEGVGDGDNREDTSNRSYRNWPLLLQSIVVE